MAKTQNSQSVENPTKSALAQIVLPETLDDIEEYLKPEFPPRHGQRNAKTQERDEDDNEVSGRRIVMDGFGRWREIRPKKHIPNRTLQLVNSTELPKMKELLGMKTPMSSRQSSRSRDNVPLPGQKSRYEAYKLCDSGSNSRVSSRQGTTPHLRHQSNTESNPVYNSLGVLTRANVFPGIGNYQWNTTTARTFTRKSITPVEERNNFFGIQSDYFGKWSAANVLNERMKKAWDEYLQSVPKAKANWEPPSQTTQRVKPKPPEPKPRKHLVPKPKPKKGSVVTDPPPFQEPRSPPSEPQAPPPYVPDGGDGGGDDNFWGFYDKPFNKPSK